MDGICEGWNKRGKCPCEYRAKVNSKYCGIHQPFVAETCAICLEDVTSKASSKRLNCGHMFHSKCVSEWLNSGNKNAHCCATCRRPWRSPLRPDERETGRVYYLPEPPEFIWRALTNEPLLPEEYINDMDPDDPPPLVFEDVLPNGGTLSILMTIERWRELTTR